MFWLKMEYCLLLLETRVTALSHLSADYETVLVRIYVLCFRDGWPNINTGTFLITHKSGNITLNKVTFH